MSKLWKFLRLSLVDKLLLAEVFLILLFSKLVVLFVSFTRLAAYLGTANLYGVDVLTNSQAAAAERVRFFLFMVSANLPWSSVCLDQALAAHFLLNRRKLPNTLFLGVKVDNSEKKLKAHAWVRCNDRIFVGGTHSSSYSVVAHFTKQFK